MGPYFPSKKQADLRISPAGHRATTSGKALFIASARPSATPRRHTEARTAATSLSTSTVKGVFSLRFFFFGYHSTFICIY
jgi:hypothetical protein